MDLRKAFIKYLMKTLGLTEQEAAAKVPEAVEDYSEVLAGLETAHKAKVNTQKEEDFNQGHQKATLDSLTKQEDEIKAKYGIKSKKKGLELIDEVVASKIPNPANPESVTEDVVKKHPVFLQRERELNQQLTEAKNETEIKVKEVLDGIASKETLAKVAVLGKTAFRGLNPVLPADAEKAARQEARLTRELEASGLKFEFQEGNPEPLVLEADGKKRKQDAHGNPVRFNDLVRTVAEDLGFEFKQAEKRDSPGGQTGTTTPPSGAGAKYTGKAPTNQAEYMEIITNDSIPMEQRAEVQDTYEKSFSGS